MSHVPRMYLACTPQFPPKHMAFTWLVPPMYLALRGFASHFILHHSSFILRFVCLCPPLRHSMLDVGCWMFDVQVRSWHSVSGTSQTRVIFTHSPRVG